MNWFNRKQKNINTPTAQKKELPDGMWYKTPGGSVVHIRELKNNSYVSPEDDYHVRIGSKEYFEILFDNKSFVELDKNLSSSDPLKFSDTKSYKDRVSKSVKSTGLNDAIRTAHGKLDGHKIVISCMDFSFIGGSMGSVVGEKITRLIEKATSQKLPLLIICASGGARMQEGMLSLMQMAKISGALERHRDSNLLYMPLLTHPTTGGVTASFAMLGDLILAEPKSLIGFAGRRVIEQTLREKLPLSLIHI